MRSVLVPLALGAFLATAVGLRAGEPPATPAPSTAQPEPAPIDSLAFLAGAWRSEDGVSEEIWSAPAGNNLMGAFRWLKPDGTPAMLEMLAITRESDAVRLRLRHYDAALNSKEENAMTLRLASIAGTRAEFVAEKDAGDLAGVNYEVKDGDLHIAVLFNPPQKADQPARPPLKFALKKR